MSPAFRDETRPRSRRIHAIPLSGNLRFRTPLRRHFALHPSLPPQPCERLKQYIDRLALPCHARQSDRQEAAPQCEYLVNWQDTANPRNSGSHQNSRCRISASRGNVFAWFAAVPYLIPLRVHQAVPGQYLPITIWKYPSGSRRWFTPSQCGSRPRRLDYWPWPARRLPGACLTVRRRA
jgi:hypothetical protein